MNRLRNILLFIALVATAQAAPFVTPSDIPPPFLRSRLPLDADTMGDLSAQLSLLAQGSSLESPAIRRATAQALALALALDPDNATARINLDALGDGKHPAAPEHEEFDRAKQKVWKMFGWLITREAGHDGNLLANFLGDTASVLDPGNSAADALKNSPEKGNWTDWVAPLASFDTEKKVINLPPAETAPKTPPVAKPLQLAENLKSSSSSIGAVLFERDPASDKYILKPTVVRMEAGGYGGDEENGRKLRMDVACQEGYEWQIPKNVSTPILRTLEEIYGSGLPKGKLRILTGKGEIYSFSHNGDELTGPGFILANAAITGTAADGTVLARLNDKSSLGLPDYFWRDIAALVDGPGGKLIVPASAEPYFTSLLALEKPEFFLKYEVLMASSPAEAIALCAKVPDESHAAAYAKFKEIKDKAGTGALGAYLANRFVRQRLVEIAQAAPYHLSAKLLAMQGAGERPRVIGRKMLAAEIFQAIDPIEAYAKLNIYELSTGSAKGMETSQEAIRVQLDRLDRYTDMQDRDLLARAKTLATDLRTFYRLIGGRGEMWEKYDKISEASKVMGAANKELRKELSKITGDPLPEDKEALDRLREERSRRFKEN